MLLVLACLDEELQDIVLAFRVDGLFWDEIAAERGITVDSARHQYKMAITLMTEAWKREDAKSGKRRWVPFPILLTQVFDAFRAEVDSDSPELDRRVRETLDRLMEEAGACDPDPESERVSVATLSPPTIQITLPPAPPTPGGMVLGVLGNVIVIGVFIAFLIRGTTPENPLSELTHARSIPALALFESGEEMGKGEAVAPLFPVKETRITFRKAVAPSHRDADRALATDPLNVASASLTLIDLARTAAQRGNTREGLALLAQHARDFPGKHNEALRRDLILLVCSAHEARGAADCAHP